MKSVVSYLCDCGYEATLVDEGQAINVKFCLNEKDITLTHLISELSHRPVTLPSFYLNDAEQFLPLAHVTLWGSYGLICVGDHESLGINFDRPELVFVESLIRHEELLKKAICDTDWNKRELLREFKANWELLANTSNHDLVLPPQLQRNEQGRFSVKGPISGRMYGIDSKNIGSVANQPKGKWVPYVTQSSLSNKRNIRGEAIVLPLSTLVPAPYKKSDITKWYIDIIDTLDEESSKYFKRSIQIRNSQFWLLFCANTPSGLTWFGLYFQHKRNKKTTLPISHSKCLDWTIDAIRVLPYHRDFIAPRGGASLALSDKKVLLVGCGSVGGELACQIAASGVGKIVLSDPDLYNIENIYRHCLPEYCTGLYKTTGLSMKIESQYLWTETVALTRKLDSFCDKSQLEQYDLIVVAIGAPTQERFFANFIENCNVNTPVLYTWLEGYGVGGHVILDCRDGNGCFKCAYVDNDNEEHGLASNLNFIECGQEVTVNHAGCGENFLPYSANASYQTAVLASSMAIKYLTGRVTKSSKSSWKGDDTDAKCAGLNMTHRYHYFDRSLMIEPLNNTFCCGERL